MHLVVILERGLLPVRGKRLNGSKRKCFQTSELKRQSAQSSVPEQYTTSVSSIYGFQVAS